MNDDVRILFEAIDAPEFDYRECAAIERWQAAAHRWPLIAQTNRVLMDRLFGRLLDEGLHVAERRHSVGRCATVALISLHGGSGRTTLAANLVAALGQNGRMAVGVDLDPQNSLGLHFGVDPSESFGLASPTATNQDVQLWFNRFRGGIAVMPFGQLSGPQIAALEASASRDSSWVQKRLEAVIPEETEILVLDTPARPSAWLRQALGIADVVLVVITPDAASYATLPATEALLEEYTPGAGGRRRARYLVNRFDARRALDRDMLASLRGMMPDRALARPIHADGIVADALARRKFVVQEAPDSQVVSEVSSLAVWIEAHANQARDIAPQPLAAVASR